MNTRYEAIRCIKILSHPTQVADETTDPHAYSASTPARGRHISYNLTLSTVAQKDSHIKITNEIQMSLKIRVILVFYTVKTTKEHCTV
jgi:hypothetical protein